MGAPLTEDQVPAGVREFREKLRDWQLAAAGWLGLDTSKVFELELAKDDVVPQMYATATWKSLEPVTARAGTPAPLGLTHVWGEDPIFYQLAHFDYDEGRALFAEVGPRPEMFTPAEKAALEQRFGTRP